MSELDKHAMAFPHIDRVEIRTMSDRSMPSTNPTFKARTAFIVELVKSQMQMTTSLGKLYPPQDEFEDEEDFDFWS